MESAITQFSAKSVEDVRAYWNARPCNIRHSSRQLGSKEYFDEVEARKYFVEPHIPIFADSPRWNGKKSPGNWLRPGHRHHQFRPGWRLGHGRGPIGSFPGNGQATGRGHGGGGPHPLPSGQCRTPFRDLPVEPYDLVYSFGVIHHTPHPERVVAEIRKYMRPQSVFKMMVYNRRFWNVFWILAKYWKRAFGKLDALVARYSEAQTCCPVTFSYTWQSVKKLLSGLRVTKVNADHIRPLQHPRIQMRHKYQKVWYFRFLPPRVFRWLERRLSWHLCVEVVKRS